MFGVEATGIIIFVPPTMRPKSPPVDVDEVVASFSINIVTMESTMLGPTILIIAS